MSNKQAGGGGVYGSLRQSREAYQRTGSVIVDGPKDLDSAIAKIAELDARIADIEAVLANIKWNHLPEELRRVLHRNAENKHGT